MRRLNGNDLAWFNHSVLPNIKTDSSPAAMAYTNYGLDGIARLHYLIQRRDINKIKEFLDSMK
jgi:hypothetical protein